MFDICNSNNMHIIIVITRSLNLYFFILFVFLNYYYPALKEAKITPLSFSVSPKYSTFIR
jgi:hypothetical protein